MKGIAVKWCAKVSGRPATLFFVYILLYAAIIGIATGAAVLVNMATNAIWGSYFLLHILAWTIYISGAGILLKGIKEMVLFDYYTLKSGASPGAKLRILVMFLLDFIITDVMIATALFLLGTVAFFSAISNDWSFGAIFWYGSGALLLGEYLQVLISGAYLKSKTIGPIYQETLITHALTEKGILNRWIIQSENVVERSGVLSIPFLLLGVYGAVTMLSGIVTLALMQLWSMQTSDSWVLFKIGYIFSIIAVALGAVYLIVQTLLKWNDFDTKVKLAGTAMFIFALLAGGSHLVLLYMGYADKSMAPLFNYGYIIVALAALTWFSVMVFMYSAMGMLNVERKTEGRYQKEI